MIHRKTPRIAILKTHPKSVIEDYKRVMELGGLNDTLDRGVSVIVKNNISWHLMYPSANTTPWQLEAVLQYLRDHSYPNITVVQNETVVTNAFKGERLNAYTDVYKKYGVRVLFNFRETDMRWKVYKPRKPFKVLDDIFPRGVRIPDFFIGRNIVHLPTVKCHIYTKMTGSMKNAFGGLLDNRRHYCHSRIHEVLADLLALQQEIHPGIFTVMDGTTVGAGAGPRTMTPIKSDLLLAGADSVAIDAVSAWLMGFDPLQEVECIRLGHERRLGCGDIEQIEMVGDDIRPLRMALQQTDNLASLGGKLFWFGPFRKLQRLMFHTPLVYAFIFASAIYHDRVWYPFKGRRVVKEWLSNSPWGELFRKYKEKT